MVERLTDRLANTPIPFRGRVVGPDAVRVDAVVADLFRDRASRPLAAPEVATFVPTAVTAHQRHLELVLIATWVLHDPVFGGASAESLLALLQTRLAALSTTAVPRLFVEDAERREELVRTCFQELGQIPEGETRAFAEDRLAVLDSVRRKQVLAEARTREETREAERKRRKAELEKLRLQEEEAARQAARTTHED